MIAVGILAALGSGYGATAFGAAPGALTINVMAPLLVGGGIAPGGAGAKAKDWDAFDAQLKEMKAQGVDAVSSDVWWGIVEQTRHVFDWRYYDALTAHLQTAGIRWVPILSFHRCGGNVGDDCDIPIPTPTRSSSRASKATSAARPSPSGPHRSSSAITPS
jgi:hypothetical protein